MLESPRMNHSKSLLAVLLLAGSGGIAAAATATATAEAPWHFAVSGDSRNCGDVVMPAIAADVRAHHAAFYWHLGDLRAIFDFDEDFRAQHPKATIAEYLNSAWPDFQRSQIEPFGDVPFFIAMGNHETVPPKTREEFTLAFADWLDAPVIRDQRLQDDAHDHKVRSYYHWLRDGVDFITLDNATADQFDAAQLRWLNDVLARDRRDETVRALVVGMHEALPESLARGHSMSDAPAAQESGMNVYAKLLEVHRNKPVYVLSSHSHFVMDGIYDTRYWQEHGGVLPGWIIGTGGAFRYALPPEAARARLARSHVYGYLLATVEPPGRDRRDPIHFEFREMTEAAVPPDLVQRFGADLIHRCYQGNSQD